MNDQKSQHVFISYVRDNQEQVYRLCEDLQSHGVKVWLDRKSIKPGARWKDAIREAIRHGDFFIACFSEEYTNRITIKREKTYMNEELTLAIEELRQFDSDREWFIPVLLSECAVPARSIGGGETLLDINWVPLHENRESGIQRILSVIKPIPPRIQNLMSALRSENIDVRGQATEVLGKIGLEAVPALIKALKDGDKIVRSSTAEALIKIGPEAKAAVPALIETLNDKDGYVRRRAADALGKIGSGAKAAVPALIETLKDEDEWVRALTAEALGKIAPEAKSVVPALIETLNDEDGLVRWRAALTLGKIVSIAGPVLIEALKDEAKYVRQTIVDALEKINTPEAQKALAEYKQKSK